MILSLLLLLCSCASVFAEAPDAKTLLAGITMPGPGFKAEVVAVNVPQARSLTASPSGTIWAGSLADSVYVIVPGRAPQVAAAGLAAPNGVAYDSENDDLYIAENARLLVLRNADAHALNGTQGPVELVANDFFAPQDVTPLAIWHGYRYLMISDQRLYMALGSPCNTPADPPQANSTCKCFWPGHGCSYDDKATFSNLGSIISGRIPAFDQRRREAHGIRNSVGMAMHPETKELWFTDNGRDSMGGANSTYHLDHPNDELNRRPTSNDTHFGFPFCYGKDLVDPEFNAKNSCVPYQGAHVNLEPHAAALGMRFSKGQVPDWPEQYQDGIFIAEHGSWDRVPPAGYKISFVDLRKGMDNEYTSFAENFYFNYTGMNVDAWLRVADVQFVNGSLYFSNDKRGEIYRITFTPPSTNYYGIVFGVCGGMFVLVAIGVAYSVYRNRRKTYQEV